MPHIYLAQWEEDKSIPGFKALRAPGGGNVGSFRFPGTIMGLFVYPEQRVISGSRYLGSHPEVALSSADKSAFETLVGTRVPIKDRDLKLRTIMRELVLDPNHYDPTGTLSWMPLTYNSRRQANFWLPPYGRLFVEPGGELLRNSTLAVYRAAYPGNRQRGSLEECRRQTGYVMRLVFGRVGDDLVPAVLPEEFWGDGFAEPESEFGDSFNVASDIALDDVSYTPSNGTSWTVLASSFGTPTFQANAAADAAQETSTTPAASFAIMSDNLSGANMSSEFTIEQLDTPGSTRSWGGAVCRMSSNGGVVNGYDYEATIDSGGTKQGRLGEFHGTSPTFTTHVDEVETINIGDTVLVEADGNDISGKINGVVTAGPITDLTHQTQVQGGIGSRIQQGSVGDIKLENFVIKDLAVGPAGFPHSQG